MANTNTSQRIKAAGNPFTKDKTLAAMKKRWREMTPAQREANIENFESAAKGKPKGGATSTKPPASKTSKPKTSAPKKTTTSNSSNSGVNGQFRKSNPPSPTVRKAGSTTGASVDPRERSLRANRRDSQRGSTAAGKAAIKKQVDAVSGSSKRNQRLIEERRRRARARALSKNRRELMARRFNDM